MASPVFKKEPYTVSADGHFVGVDGYEVPKNFAEFYEREPLSVRRFLMKKLHRQIVDETILDLEQDLLLHLHYLPLKSKHRKKGKTDIIQCFDPAKHHGASSKRFHNYVALCLSNRFCTILHKQKKNPVCNPNNFSIVTHTDMSHGQNSFAQNEITDEIIHKNSRQMVQRARQYDEKAYVQTLFVNRFKEYVTQHAPEVMPIIEAISDASSLKDARQLLGVDARTFDKQRVLLEILRDCFTRGEDYTLMKKTADKRRSLKIRTSRDMKKVMT